MRSPNESLEPQYATGAAGPEGDERPPDEQEGGCREHHRIEVVVPPNQRQLREGHEPHRAQGGNLKGPEGVASGVGWYGVGAGHRTQR